MTEVHNENVEINDIITSISNIPVINTIESSDEESDEDAPISKRTRVNGPARPRLAESRSFTHGTSTYAMRLQLDRGQTEESTLTVERPSRATSSSPTGSGLRTSSPSDNLVVKDVYRETLLKECYSNRVHYLKGGWLREIVAARRARAATEQAEPASPMPHGTKRKTNSESYDQSSFFSQSAPSESATPQA